jgi:hypothetical protein
VHQVFTTSFLSHFLSAFEKFFAVRGWLDGILNCLQYSPVSNREPAQGGGQGLHSASAANHAINLVCLGFLETIAGAFL